MDNTYLDKIPFFFIVGRPRSGTTLLRTLFDAHPNVSIPPECHLIINLYPKYGKIKYWTEKHLLAFFKDLQQQWLFDTWNVNMEKLKEDLLACAGKSSYSKICKVVYHNNTSLFDKQDTRIFGDKNPGYAIYTERLLNIFPDAKFIHIIRDYRDNYVSIKDVDFELPVTSLVVEKWKYFIKKFNRAKEKYPDSHYVIRYEDLVQNPEYYFSKLCEFTGIDYLPEVFDFYKKKENIEETKAYQLIKKYHTSLMQKINTGRIGLWKDQLPDKQIKIADATAGKYAEIAGYERKYKNIGLGTYLYSIPGILFARFLALATIIVDHFPYKLRMNILNKWPWYIAKHYLRIFNPGKLKELREMISD